MTSTDPVRRPAEWAYVLPFGVFMAFTFVGGTWKGLYPATYALKTLAVAALLAACWRSYTRVRWTHLGSGVAVGVLGLVQWVGMEKLLMAGGGGCRGRA